MSKRFCSGKARKTIVVRAFSPRQSGRPDQDPWWSADKPSPLAVAWVLLSGRFVHRVTISKASGGGE